MDDYETIDMDEQLQDEKSDRVVKCILFENGLYVISEIEEIVAEYGMPNCKLVNPFTITETGHLETFPKHCGQSEILMSSDKFLTIFDPSDNILNKYDGITAG